MAKKRRVGFQIPWEQVRQSVLSETAPWSLALGERTYTGNCSSRLEELPGALAAIYLTMRAADRLKFVIQCAALGDADDEIREMWERRVELGETDAATIKILRVNQQLTVKLDRRTVKPRNVSRDNEIVRLREVERLSFGKIGRKLKISRSAAESAYYRKTKASRRVPANESAGTSK